MVKNLMLPIAFLMFSYCANTNGNTSTDTPNVEIGNVEMPKETTKKTPENNSLESTENNYKAELLELVNNLRKKRLPMW